MVGRNIQGIEIMKFVLDFRSFGHFKTDTFEQAPDAVHDARDRMQTARPLSASGQSDIDPFRLKPLFKLRCLQGLLARLNGFLDRFLGGIDSLAGGRTFFGRQLTKLFQLLCQFAFLAQVFDANRIECRQIIGVVDGFKSCIG